MSEETDDRGQWTSASGAPYDVLCPGRHRAHRAAKPPITDSGAKDAQFGNRVHDALMRSDPTGLNVDELRAYTACRETEEAAMRKFFGLSKVGSVKTFREVRLWIEFDDYKHSGRLDVWHKLGSMALIVEYKTLWGDVEESPFNPQLRDQVVLLAANDLMLDTVGVVVAQPPLKRDPVITIYNGDDLELSRAEVGLRVKASNQPDAPRYAGRRQCEHCNAKPDCPAYTAWIQSITPQEVGFPASDNPVSKWTVDQWQAFLTNKSVIEKRIADIYSTAKEMLAKDPDCLPGFRLASSGSVTTITDINTLFQRFEALGGDLDRFMQCLSLRQGKFEQVLSEVTGASGVKLDRAIDTLFEGIADHKEKGMTIRKVKQC